MGRKSCFPTTSRGFRGVSSTELRADRDQLYTAWNAVANRADLAGKVSVTISAESDAGFDRGKLNNGVREPLREADLIQ